MPTTVHPRACGERVRQARCPIAGTGSSPRLRGTLRRTSRGACASRFIPAPAGNARPACWPTSATTVHPRACGERNESVRVPVLVAGSSPRLRGTPAPARTALRTGRFIPAPAGNAVWPRGRYSSLHGSSPRLRGTQTPGSCGPRRRPVHPRACGERLFLQLFLRQRNPGQ